MNILTNVSTNQRAEKLLVVTAKDCENFSVNEYMNEEQAREYLSDLEDSISTTKKFLNIK